MAADLRKYTLATLQEFHNYQETKQRNLDILLMIIQKIAQKNQQLEKLDLKV